MNKLYRVEPEYNKNNIDKVVRYYSAPINKRVYFTRSVRNATPEDRKRASELIEKGSIDGKIFYDPMSMTEQDNDLNGIVITNTNLKGTEFCGMVEEEADVESKGSAWDNGMSFFLGKPIHIKNEDYLIEKASTNNANKSYAQLLIGISKNQNFKDIIPSYNKIMYEIKRLHNIRDLMIDKHFVADFVWKGYDNIDLLKLGMVFAAGAPINITNINTIEPTPGKSHENVIIEMNKQSRIHLMESAIKPEDYSYIKIN